MLLTALLSPRCVSISFPKRLLCFEKQLWLFLLSSDETSDLSVNALKKQLGGQDTRSGLDLCQRAHRSSLGSFLGFRALITQLKVCSECVPPIL